MNNPWQLLGIAPTSDVRAIKRAYAALLKLNRPEDDPDAFHRLRWALENALQQAARLPASNTATDREAEKPVTAQQPDAAVPTQPANQLTEPGIDKPLNLALPPEPTKLEASPELLVLMAPPEQKPMALPAPKPLRKHDRPPMPVAQEQTAYDVQLRPTQQVVDELLRQLGSAQFNPATLDLHLQQCPELINLNNQASIETLLLQRLADGAAAHPAALLHMVTRFAWRELGTAKRLGQISRMATKWLTALERRLHIADFEQFLACGPRLTKAAYEQRREVRLLGALHRGLTLRRKWFIALLPSTRKAMCDLINAYRKRYGLEAADQVFGVTQLSFWDRLNVKRGLNLPRFILFQLRILAIGLVFEVLLLAREIPTSILISVSEGKPLFSQFSYVSALVAMCTVLCCGVISFISVFVLGITWLERKIKHGGSALSRLIDFTVVWTLKRMQVLLQSKKFAWLCTLALTVGVIAMAIPRWMGRKLKQSVVSLLTRRH